MSLWSEIESNDKKGLFKSDDNIVAYPTGYTVLDYANGFWSETVDENGERKMIPMIGITGGSLVSIIGGTGTGKTTFALQMGWNIVKHFDSGMLFLVDCEKTSTRQRVINIVRADYDEPRIRLTKNHSSIEDVLEMFTTICDAKENGGKEYMYEVKNKSFNGKSFWQYVPTVFIIDSLPAFNGKEYNVENLGNQIDQMKASKDITRFYTNVLHKAWQYNCIFLVVNHIRPNSIMNQYAPPPPGLMMINPQTETLPRGSVAQYFSNTYFRIKSKKSNAYTIKDNGFTGYKCEFVMAKSKTNMVGTSFPVTFNSEIGFDPIYSILEFADSLGLVKGRNPYLYIEGFEGVKFNRRDFNSLMNTSEQFREGVLKILRPYYEGLLGVKRSVNEEAVELPPEIFFED